MEELSAPGSVELVLEGEWAPLLAIDEACGERTMIEEFPSLTHPERMITITHDPDMKLEDCNVYTFTRVNPDLNSFWVILVNAQNNVARASLLSVDPETDGDAEAFFESIQLQSAVGLTLPIEHDLEELGEIVGSFVESQVTRFKLDIE